jgi:hypothetical protein
MGASGWTYFTPYQADLAAALRAAQIRALEERDYYWFREDEGQAHPATVEEIWQCEEFWEVGTHSILDVTRLVRPDDVHTSGGMRPIPEHEIEELFGTRQPERADFDRGSDSGALVFEEPRWGGCCVTLYAEGQPSEIAFWGITGD